jgi:hypothetical protein
MEGQGGAKVPSNQYSERGRERERERKEKRKQVSVREREKLCFLGEFWQNGENLVFKFLFFLAAKLLFFKISNSKKNLKIHQILYLNPVSEMYRMIMLK